MSDKPRLKYEKPVSIDMGRVAPILGDTCSVGDGATDCPAGMNNDMVPICQPNGASAANDCRTGSSAGTFCWPVGSSAKVYCQAGSGFGVAAAGVDGEYPAPSEGEGYEYPSVPVNEEPLTPDAGGYEEPLAPGAGGYDEPAAPATDGYEYPPPPAE